MTELHVVFPRYNTRGAVNADGNKAKQYKSAKAVIFQRKKELPRFYVRIQLSWLGRFTRTSTCSTGERDFDRIRKRQETCLLQLHYEERVSWFQNILYIIVLHLGTWN